MISLIMVQRLGFIVDFESVSVVSIEEFRFGFGRNAKIRTKCIEKMRKRATKKWMNITIREGRSIICGIV